MSFLFYFLVVYVPERRKKRIIIDNLRRMYRGIKRDILYSVIFASQKGGRRDLEADSETIEALMTLAGFRNAFEKGREADEGFYAFENQMSDSTWEFQQIVLSLEMLSKQIEYPCAICGCSMLFQIRSITSGVRSTFQQGTNTFVPILL